MLSRLACLLVALAAALSLPGCASGGAGENTGGSGGGGDTSLTVLAAASLAESFTELAEAYEAATGTEVSLSFAASSTLAAQVLDGAPADVIALADEVTMGRVVAGGGTLGAPELVATNQLEIVVEAGNPHGITSLADLADPSLLVVLAAAEVPAGRYAAEVLGAADVEVAPVSYEASVRAVLNKVVLGEADAGLVYRTDVIAGGEAVTGVEIPEELNALARYPVAVAAEAQSPDAARAFVEFVRSDEGRAVLVRHGFGVL